jgi:hypothetical protein
MAKGLVERIGQAGCCPNYEAAIAQCLGELPIGLAELSAIGFKAVHAGPVTGARLVDDVVLNAMEEFTFLAPAHNPPYIAAMRAFQHQVPTVPLVALFETAFLASCRRARSRTRFPTSGRNSWACGVTVFTARAIARRASARRNCWGARHPAHFVPSRRQFQPGGDPQRRRGRQQLRNLAAIGNSAQ